MNEQNPKPRKPEVPQSEDEPEEDKEDNHPFSPCKSFVVIGDLQISTTQGNLQSCKRMAEEMLRSQPIRSYLNLRKKRIIFPSYVD